MIHSPKSKQRSKAFCQIGSKLSSTARYQLVVGSSVFQNYITTRRSIIHHLPFCFSSLVPCRGAVEPSPLPEKPKGPGAQKYGRKNQKKRWNRSAGLGWARPGPRAQPRCSRCGGARGPGLDRSSSMGSRFPGISRGPWGVRNPKPSD